MTLRSKIFDSFSIAKEVMQSPLTDADAGIGTTDNLFTDKDPFDFYRKSLKLKSYVPVTQRGLRRAFADGLIGIEFFIEMATSLRPLADEARDIDEIARLLSQQKLTTNPNLHSVTILRNLIKDENAETALYAAEGLNTIENTFIEKIQRIREKIKENKERNDSEKNNYILFYILGLLYLKFAGLLETQSLIQLFYLNEALSALKTANNIKRNNKRILRTTGDVYILLGRNKPATRIFTYLFSKDGKDSNSLMKLAECFYNTGDYENVFTLASLAAKTGMELDEISNLIIYQWLLNL